MGRKASDRPRRYLPKPERRIMLHTLVMLARDGRVYERDLPPWWIPTLMRAGIVRRVEPGVLEVVVREGGKAK